MGRVLLGLRAHHMLTAGRGAHGGLMSQVATSTHFFGGIFKLICELFVWRVTNERRFCTNHMFLHLKTKLKTIVIVINYPYSEE